MAPVLSQLCIQLGICGDKPVNVTSLIQFIGQIAKIRAKFKRVLNILLNVIDTNRIVLEHTVTPLV